MRDLNHLPLLVCSSHRDQVTALFIEKCYGDLTWARITEVLYRRYATKDQVWAPETGVKQDNLSISINSKGSHLPLIVSTAFCTLLQL